MKFNFLLADGEIPVVQKLRYGVEPAIEIEVDERWFFILHFIERGRFLELTAQVGELVVVPDLLEAKLLALLLVPRVVEVQ